MHHVIAHHFSAMANGATNDMDRSPIAAAGRLGLGRRGETATLGEV
jgi:hypothetical protein